MSNQELIIKPSLDFEVKAEIKSLGMIEDNIQEVKEKTIKLNEYYKTVNFTEETMKQATEEKANVNKFKKAVADYRKNIVKEYNKPIENFEKTAKETEKLLIDTYNTINEQVDRYNNQKKEQIKQETERYFNEYMQSKNIDFVKYEQAKINITLNASKKKLQEQCKTFIDKIVDDLNLIETQKHKAEILVEYKQTLNVSQAITTVTNRFRAIEEEKKKQEEKVIHIEMNEKHEITKESYEQLEEIDNVNNNEFKIIPAKNRIILILNVTEEQEEKIKQFLDLSNIEYEREEI